MVALGLVHATAAAGAGRAEQSATASVVVEVNLGEAMFPGHASDLDFSVVNRSGGAIRFTSVTIGGVVSSDEAACPAANVAMHRDADVTLLVAAESMVVVSLPDAVTMSAAAPDGCQGKSFAIGLLLS